MMIAIGLAAAVEAGSFSSESIKAIAISSPIDWGSVPQWVSAVGQLTTAAGAVYIAWRMYKYTRLNIRLTFYKYLTDTVNDWNKTLIQSEKNMKAIARLRPPIIDHPTDSIVFMYLNYLRFNYVVGKDTLLSTDALNARLQSGARWFRNFEKDVFDDYMSRGYESDFVKLMAEYYASARKELEPAAPPP